MFNFDSKTNKYGTLNIFLIEDNEGKAYIRSNINNSVYTHEMFTHNNDKNIFLTEIYKLIERNDPQMRLAKINIKVNKEDSLESLENLSNLFDNYEINKKILTKIEQQDTMFYLDKLIKYKAGIQMTTSIEKSSPNPIGYSYVNNISEKEKKQKVKVKEEFPKDTIVVYTDGSLKHKNKEKKQGYGIIIGFSDGEKIDTIYKIKAKLRANLFNGIDEVESFAIKRAILFLDKRRENGEISKDLPIQIRSDNLTSIIYLNNLSDVKRNKSYNLKKIIQEIKEKVKDYNINYSWIKGHSKNYHNNIADKLAKESLTHKNNSFIVAHKNEDNLKKIRKSIN